MKNMITYLQHTYDEITDENEIAIIDKNGHIGMRYTRFFTILLQSGLIASVVLSNWSVILNVVLPKNESRPHYFWMEVEYFVDQERYFYLIMLHITATSGITVILTNGATAIYIAYFQHVCGIFEISSYRIERAMKNNLLRNINKNEKLIYKGLTYAVYIHRKAVELSEYFIYTYEIVILYVFSAVGIMLSLNMFQVVLNGNDVKEIMVPFILVICIFICVFIANYIGQQIIDSNNNVFLTAYNVQWYETPVYIQKLILFLLQRGSKVYSINIRGLLIMSLEAFAALLNTTISFFTVLYSAK